MKPNAIVKLVRSVGTPIHYGAIARVVPWETYPEKASELITQVGEGVQDFICVDWLHGPGEDGFYMRDRFEEVRACQA